MAAPEGGSVLMIPRRYLVAGALALFINAGVPPEDVVATESLTTRQAIVAPRYTPPPLSTFVRQGQVEAPASVDAPTPGSFVRSQVIPPYFGPTWRTLPQFADVVAGVVPEGDQQLNIPIYRSRVGTQFAHRGVPITDVVPSIDELASSRRSIVQPPYPKYLSPIFVVQKATDLDTPAESGTIVVALPLLYPKASLVQTGRVPPPDVTPINPISDHIRIVSATYPYRGESFVHHATWLLIETPVESGTILIPNPAKSWPNASSASWIQRQGTPPAIVVVSQDEEAWASRRSIVVPTQPYNPGQFATAKVPPSSVVVPQDEEAWTSRRSINLHDYSSLWANPALTRAFIKQIEEDLSLRSGNVAIVIPPPFPYRPGQVRYGFIARPNVVPVVDELASSRRVISLAEWRQKYFAGGSFVWTPRPDNLIVPIISACISVDQGPITLCTVDQGPITIITWEVEC